MKILQKIANQLKSGAGTVKTEVDIRDIFVFGGLFFTGYGLYLLRPWLGFSIFGLILMGLGLFLGKRT